MSSNNIWRDYNTISDEWHENRKKLTCCKDMIKTVNTGLIDWFNEFYRDRYFSSSSSLTRPPIRGYYIFNTDHDDDNNKAIMQIHFCPFCGKILGSL